MLSNIKINYLSYRVVPIIKNNSTPVIENKPRKVEPVSEISTNIGYNKNNPNNNSYVYMKDGKKEKTTDETVGNHFDIRI